MVPPMKTMKIIDMTLRETAGVRESALTFKEKLEMARGLDRLKVDVIELPMITGGKPDQLSNKTIASLVTGTLSATVGIEPRKTIQLFIGRPSQSMSRPLSSTCS